LELGRDLLPHAMSTLRGGGTGVGRMSLFWNTVLQPSSPDFQKMFSENFEARNAYRNRTEMVVVAVFAM